MISGTSLESTLLVCYKKDKLHHFGSSAIFQYSYAYIGQKTVAVVQTATYVGPKHVQGPQMPLTPANIELVLALCELPSWISDLRFHLTVLLMAPLKV